VVNIPPTVAAILVPAPIISTTVAVVHLWELWTCSGTVA
jgi:hypothetical protein